MVGRWSSLTGGGRRGGWRVSAGSVILAFLLVHLGVAASGCKKQEQKVQKERAVNVRVWTAENRPLRPFVESIGTLNPYEIVNVSSELDGILKTINVDEGSPVTPGQVIADDQGDRLPACP